MVKASVSRPPQRRSASATLAACAATDADAPSSAEAAERPRRAASAPATRAIFVWPICARSPCASAATSIGSTCSALQPTSAFSSSLALRTSGSAQVVYRPRARHLDRGPRIGLAAALRGPERSPR